MLQVDNQTPFKVSLGVFPNEEGIDHAYVVVKATFVVGPGGRVAFCETQDDIVLVDQPSGEPVVSSLLRASEMTLAKPGTDVLLRGHAHAPGGRPAREVDVTLRVGTLSKTVRVFGDRVWRPGIIGYKISDSNPFDRIPLVYERAFGGTDPEPIDPEKVDHEPRNPIGRGLVPEDSRSAVDGLPLPNLEDPSRLIRGPKDRPAPACFGPIAPHWEPRKSYAGTYDEAWTRARSPYLPTDFDPRFFQAAPPEMIAPGYLKGGEPVELLNATPDGRLNFRLPDCLPEAMVRFDGRDYPYRPNLDTVCLDVDSGRLSMVWRLP